MTTHFAKNAALLAAVALALALPVHATVTVEVAADRLGASDGSPAPTTSLVLLVADLGGTGPNRVLSGALSPFGYLDGNRASQLVVFRSDLSALGAPGALALSAPGLRLENDPSGRWGEGTPLYLVWFPTLDAASSSLPDGAPYGFVRLGETPRDGGFATFSYLTPTGGSGLFPPGPSPANAAAAPASQAVVDGSTDPFIFVAPEILPSPVSTSYGSPSAPLSFAVSGVDLSGPLTVTAPAGFEVSLNADGPFADSVGIPASAGGLAPTSVFVRLRGSAPVSGNYDGVAFGIVGGGADPATVRTSSSGNTVAPKALSVGGVTARNKIYDATFAATVEGTPFFEGLVNGDSFPFTASLTWVFTDKRAGSNRSVSPLETIDAPSENYVVPTPVLNTFITTRNVTVAGASVVAKPYDGTRDAAIDGAYLEGVLPGDVVGVVGGGTFSSANAGTDIVVSTNFTLVGPDAPNYRIFQQPTLRGTIQRVPQTIQLSQAPPLMQPTNARVDLSGIGGGSSGLPLSYQIASGPGRIVNRVLTFTAPGEVVVEISQGGGRNFEPAETVRLVFEASGLPQADLVAGSTLGQVLGRDAGASPMRRATLVSRRLRPVSGFVGIYNRGDLSDPLRVVAGGGDTAIRVSHFDATGNATAQILSGRYLTPAIDENSAAHWVRIQATPDRRRLERRVRVRNRIVRRVLRRNLTVGIRATSSFSPSSTASGSLLFRTL